MCPGRSAIDQLPELGCEELIEGRVSLFDSLHAIIPSGSTFNWTTTPLDVGPAGCLTCSYALINSSTFGINLNIVFGRANSWLFSPQCGHLRKVLRRQAHLFRVSSRVLSETDDELLHSDSEVRGHNVAIYKDESLPNPVCPSG